MARNPNPAALREPLAQRGARLRGCVSLVTFFAQAKKVTRPPWMAVETYRDVSRFSRKPIKAKAKSWIPAFAGMTRREDEAKALGSRFRGNDEKHICCNSSDGMQKNKN